MIPAQEWYNYQESYQKYGLNLKKDIQEERVRKPGKEKSRITAADRMRILVCTLIAGFMIMGIIFMSAYAATLNYRISEINEVNAALEGEIDMLSVQIQKEDSIQNIERKASGQIGMVTPSERRCIYLGKGN